ncbi:MAG: class IV adenylate cyclase [Bryobacterales bacterium]|nr:class IV adenylate cyclase [Bryobacterales bacterium]
MKLEIEVKLPFEEPPSAMRRRLRGLGYVPYGRRVFEANTVYDTPDQHLRKSGLLLRLRSVGGTHLLTYKGPAIPGPHKTREEIEVSLNDSAPMAAIWERLGYQPLFRYEKYRTEFHKPRTRGLICLDETPIGNFLELEGTGAWIDRTARALGYPPDRYITESYGALYLEWSRNRGNTPRHMTFEMLR